MSSAQAFVRTVEESVDVNISVSEAYSQWSRFEDFPLFMEGVKTVTHLENNQVRWKAQVGGTSREWTAWVTETIPDRRIEWAAAEGAHNVGAVTLYPLENGKTRIVLRIKYVPRSGFERVGDSVSAYKQQVKNDLERFKRMVEARRSDVIAV